MKISEAWLREWVNPAIATDELIHLVTMAGLEVDSCEPAANVFTGVVVGEVLSAERHPDADKLSLCQVSDGTSTFQVVCGASNVRQGLKVPFAKIGAKLTEDFVIKKAKLRGVESNGMLCSAEELGMAETADGLLELPADAPVGTDIRAYLTLDDKLIEVDLTPNRGDCLSIAGLAREVGVLTGSKVTAPVMNVVPAAIAETFPVIIDAPQDCPRYLGRVIRNINPEVETPLWLQEKLRRCGLRSIDPVVDVTNYVLLELGQPLHAFDYTKLEGGIIVRKARAGETLVLLDGKEVTLSPDTLLIADHQKALAMAGIMGGKHSAVGPLTRDLFLESAYFSPLAIAGRARSHGMHTDAAHRYERGVDFELQARAMERATELLQAIVGGQPGPIIEVVGELPASRTIRLRKARIGELLGLVLPEEEVLGILQRLGITKAGEDEFGWSFAVPSWRFDVAIEEDLIEELARVHGYDNLPVIAPQIAMHLKPATELKTGVSAMRHCLANLGYQEVVTYSFVDAELDQALSGLADVAGYQPVALANPISQDMAVMRSNLWPGLIKTLKHNQNRQQTRARLFESGLTFTNINNKLEQKLKVASLVWGAAVSEQWGQVARVADFFDLKGDLEVLLGLAHDGAAWRFVADTHPALQPGQTARIYRGEQAVGWIGALHPTIAQAIDITGKVFLAELDYEHISTAALTKVQDVSRFPAVRRDLALIIDEQVAAAAVLAQLRESAGPDLLEIGIFDLYQGHNIVKGKKSLALGLTFQHPSRTLSDTDINPIIDRCINALQAKFKAELR
jgi:phenylalanyl-tRNA synthetase beta chain